MVAEKVATRIEITKENMEEILTKRLESLSHLEKTANLQSEDSKKWIASNLSLLGIPAKMLDTCVEILEHMAYLKVVWLHLQECTGCSESLLRTETPSFDVMVFNMFRIEYHDLVLGASGHGAVKTLESAVENEEFVLLVEGSVPMGDAKDFITLGNRNGYDEVSHVIKHAKTTFAVGTCSSFGGIQTAYPNPTNAYSLTQLFDSEIVNIPGCPPSDKNIIATLMYYYLFLQTPPLDSLNRPLWAYSKSVHDLCERKGFFMSGDFVESFDDSNMANGYCLYKVGCKGPYTYNNCPKVKFNAKTSWPVQGGHGCIGCSEPNFWDNFGNIEKPLSNKSFIGLNSSFIKSFKPSAIIKSGFKEKLSASNADSIISNFAKENNIKKLTFVSMDDEMLLMQYLDSKAFSIANFNFEINPKLVINAYQTKNKQNKRLYENYKNAFSKRFNSLQTLGDNSFISNNMLDMFSLFLLLLNENNELDSKSVNAINSGKFGELDSIFKIDSLLTYAREFKFPHNSELPFKIKQEGDGYNIDLSKGLTTCMAYAIGGLDIYGICYSITASFMDSLAEFLVAMEGDIVLHGKFFDRNINRSVNTLLKSLNDSNKKVFVIESTL